MKKILIFHLEEIDVLHMNELSFDKLQNQLFELDSDLMRENKYKLDLTVLSFYQDFPTFKYQVMNSLI